MNGGGGGGGDGKVNVTRLTICNFLSSANFVVVNNGRLYSSNNHVVGSLPKSSVDRA